MAEGPVVHYYVRRLRRVLLHKNVTVSFGTRALKVKEKEFENIRIDRIEAYGKQFRIYCSTGTIILIHLLMWGSWSIYRKNRPWDKPRDRARIVFHTATHHVVAFSAPVVKVLTPRELENDKWGNLGPDPLRSDFSFKEFSRRLDMQNGREIGEVLLNQQVISGIGNILRVEILFYAHIHPRRRVNTLSNAEKNEIIRWTFKLSQTWLQEMGKKKSWLQIYRASGKPCPVCSMPIRFFRQASRVTYACPHCQQ